MSVPMEVEPPPQFWLDLPGGLEAVRAFLIARTLQEQAMAMEEHPLLCARAFPMTIALLGAQQPDPRLGAQCRQAAGSLQNLQERIRSRAPESYAQRLMYAVRQLLEVEGEDRVACVTASVSLLAEVQRLLPSDADMALHARVGEAELRLELAQSDAGEPAQHLERAIALYLDARDRFVRNPTGYAAGLVGEAQARALLAGQGIAPVDNLREAVRLLEQARSLDIISDEALIGVLAQEAFAHQQLADHDETPSNHLRAASRLFQQAIDLSRSEGVGGLPYAELLLGYAYAEIDRADSGAGDGSSLPSVLAALDEVRAQVPRGSQPYIRAFLHAGWAHRVYADLGHDVVRNLESALHSAQVAEELLASDDPRLPSCLNDQANALVSLARLGLDAEAHLDRALALYRRARALARSLRAIDRDAALRAERISLVEEASVWEERAATGRQRRDNLDRALALYEEAESLGMPRGSQYGLTQMNKGTLYARRATLQVDPAADLTRAIACFEAARAAMPERNLDFALTLLNEAQARLDRAEHLAQPREELELALQRAREAERSVGSSVRDRIEALRQQADAHAGLADLGVDVQGNRGMAAQLLDAAQDLLTRIEAPPPSYQIRIATGCLKLAELDIAATENYQRAADLFSRAAEQLPRQSELRRRCLTNEGVARERLARLGVDPITNFECSLALAETAQELMDPGSIDFALAMFNQGVVHENLAHLGIAPEHHRPAAIACFQRARDGLPPGSPDLARALAAEANCRYRGRAGAIDADPIGHAVALYLEAGALFRENACFLEAIKAYRAAGEVGVVEQCWNVARLAYQHAIAAAEEVRGTILLTLDRKAWMEQNQDLFTQVVRACLQAGESHEALLYFERGHARTLADRLFAADSVPRNIAPHDLDAFRTLQREARRLDRELSQPPDQARPLDDGSGVERVAALTRRRVEIAERLHRYEEEFRRADPTYLPVARPATIDDLQALATSLDRTLIFPWIGPDSSTIFFVSPSGTIKPLTLPAVTWPHLVDWMLGTESGRVMESWIGAYLAFRDSGIGRQLVDRQTWMRYADHTLARVYTEFMSPVVRYITERSISRVTFIVGGVLSLLPLHAACRWEGDTRVCALDELDITYAPSATVLAHCCARAGRVWEPVLALGNTEADTPDKNLPFSAAEVSLIAEHLGSAGVATTVRANTPIPPADVEALVRGHGTVHLACHGIWDPVDPLKSGLMLGNGAMLSLDRLIADTDLRSVRLAVLSACESGSGYERGTKGEEYLGLPAGFMIAGASSVVGSLWLAVDISTALLMVSFYEQLLAGESIADSLRAAQQRVRHLTGAEARTTLHRLLDHAASSIPPPERAAWRDAVDDLGEQPFEHPYFWAAFALFGDPRPVIEAVRSPTA